MIKRNPYVAMHIEEKYLNEEIIDFFVKVIISNNINIYYPVPNRLWKNEKFVNYAINSCKDMKDLWSY